MFVGRPLPQVVNAQSERAAFLRALHHAFVQWSPADFGEKCENIDLHVAQASCLRSKFERASLKLAPLLFHDLERSLLSVAASRTGEQSPNGVNSLAVATDDFSDIALSHLKLEDGHPATGNFRKHDFVWKLDELPDDELEELFHEREFIRT
jgi:hypothetical protein